MWRTPIPIASPTSWNADVTHRSHIAFAQRLYIEVPAGCEIQPQPRRIVSFIEAFNGRLRDECLNVHQFTSIEDARTKIEAWRVDYNARRPHSSLGHLTPNEFVAQRQAERAAIEAGFSG